MHSYTEPKSQVSNKHYSSSSSGCSDIICKSIAVSDKSSEIKLTCIDCYSSANRNGRCIVSFKHVERNNAEERTHPVSHQSSDSSADHNSQHSMLSRWTTTEQMIATHKKRSDYGSRVLLRTFGKERKYTSRPSHFLVSILHGA